MSHPQMPQSKHFSEFQNAWLASVIENTFTTVKCYFELVSFLKYLSTSLFCPPKATTVLMLLRTSSAKVPAFAYADNSFSANED